MSSIKTFWFKHYVKIIFVFFAIAYLVPLANRMLWMPDETRYAEISREMVSSGDWVVPQIINLDYFEKPVGGYWLNNISQMVFGHTPFAVRFSSALTCWVTGLLIFLFVRRFFASREKAAAAAVVYLSCFEIYVAGTYASLDSMLTLWFDLALFAFYFGLEATEQRAKLGWYALLGAAAGLAFLTKGFLAFVVPGIIVFPYLLYRRNLMELRHLWIVLIALAAVSLPWSLMVNERAPDYWRYFFWVEHVKRFLSSDAQHKSPVYYFIPVLLLGFMPWTGVVYSAIKRIWRASECRNLVVFLLFWLVMPFLFFSISKGKLASYIMPCFAPLAILVGVGLMDLIKENVWRPLRVNAWINLVFGFLIALVLALLGKGVIGHKVLYQPSETLAYSLVVGIFVAWGLLGVMSLRRRANAFWMTALCPLAFGLLLGPAIPQSSIYSKQPGAFVRENKNLLVHSKYILANDAGVAYSIAWELRRKDIRMFLNLGELEYGLSDDSTRGRAKDKFIGRDQLANWLKHARTEGDVSLLVRKIPSAQLNTFPKADKRVRRGRLTLLYYRQAQVQGHSRSRSVSHE